MEALVVMVLFYLLAGILSGAMRGTGRRPASLPRFEPPVGERPAAAPPPPSGGKRVGRRPRTGVTAGAEPPLQRAPAEPEILPTPEALLDPRAAARAVVVAEILGAPRCRRPWRPPGSA